jgi:hypothetical protein
MLGRFLEGKWVIIVGPQTGQTIIIVKSFSGYEAVWWRGQSILRESAGDYGSNLKLAGQGYDCYYYVSPISPEKMAWNYRGGTTSVCPPSTVLAREPPK